MSLGWNVTELGNAAQLAGLDAVGLIGAIVKAANNARMHKKNCKQFAQHLKLIGNLLQQLKLSELKKRSETNEPLEQLEDSLRKAYVLVHSCENKSYLYLLALGWNIVHQFKQTQAEIDNLLSLIPLITLVEHHRPELSQYVGTTLSTRVSDDPKMFTPKLQSQLKNTSNPEKTLSKHHQLGQLKTSVENSEMLRYFQLQATSGISTTNVYKTPFDHQLHAQNLQNFLYLLNLMPIKFAIVRIYQSKSQIGFAGYFGPSTSIPNTSNPIADVWEGLIDLYEWKSSNNHVIAVYWNTTTPNWLVDPTMIAYRIIHKPRRKNQYKLTEVISGVFNKTLQLTGIVSEGRNKGNVCVVLEETRGFVASHGG
ncbi:hypothetical protein KI387_002091, partial [Taxus chinensis]